MSNQGITIVKVGTGVLTKDDGRLNLESIQGLSKNVAGLINSGNKVILVSSGAVGAGVTLFDLDQYPSDIPTRQAAAAIGQARLMQRYQEAFSEHEITIAQILLSSYDLQEKTHRERAKSVLKRLLNEENVIPIVNENDVVSLRELTKTDNDMLASYLSVIMNAKRLVLLTSVDGLLDDHGQVIPEVSDVSDASKRFAKDSSGKFSIGGMKSKLDAVGVATNKGVEVVIGNGEHPERLQGYSDRSSIGTYFSA